MHPNRQFPGSYALLFACFVSCHASFVLSFEAREPSLWVLGMFPWGCVVHRWLLFKGGT